MLKKVLLLCLAGITLLIFWFTISNYRKTQPLADEMLFGVAHSLHAAIEFSVLQDPSLHALSKFHAHDIIYFALVDNKGTIRFDSNPELIGTRLQDRKILQSLSAETMTGNRVRLASGEEAYELITHVHIPEATLGLRLVIHTNRADAVIHSARVNMVVMITLLVFSWFLAAVVYRYAHREEQHRLELSRQENLARMGEMGAMLAHEIRNPLAGIKGFAQLIQKKPEDPRTRDSAQRIVVETLRLEELTTDLLAFARSDDFPVTTIQMDDLIKQTVSMIDHDAEIAHVIVTTDCPKNLEVRGNRDRLAQVLLNVVKNGLQAMPEGGSLSVTAKASNSGMTLTVRDTGKGINPKDMQRIFEPFFTTKARGTGLGLALCKKVIEEHNGTIAIESSSSGTTVSMVLSVAWLKGEA